MNEEARDAENINLPYIFTGGDDGKEGGFHYVFIIEKPDCF